MRRPRDDREREVSQGPEEEEGDLDEVDETERGEKREVGPEEIEPEPEHDKGEITEEAVEEAEEELHEGESHDRRSSNMDRPSDQFEPGSDSLSFPDDTIVGILDDPDAAAAVVDELLASGVPEEQLRVLCCESGAERMDPQGERHGALGQLQRVVQHFGDKEAEHAHRQAQELEAGNFLVAAPAEEEERDRLADVFRAHGGRYVHHYGSWTVTRLEP